MSYPTQKRLKEVLTYNQYTGIFTRNSTSKVVGTTCTNNYLRVTIDYTECLLHRLAFVYMTGVLPEVVDHKDHDGINNIWSNLRATNRSGNARNTSLFSTNTSGITGVTYDNSRKKWMAQIRILGINKSKRFTTKFGAIRQRIKWNREFNFHENHGK